MATSRTVRTNDDGNHGGGLAAGQHAGVPGKRAHRLVVAVQRGHAQASRQDGH